MSAIERVVVLGCGFAGTAVARLARDRGLRILANVRSAERAASAPRAARAARSARHVRTPRRPHRDAHRRRDPGGRGLSARRVDGRARRSSPRLDAGPVTYLSSTGVYGAHRGHVDDETPPCPHQQRGPPRSSPPKTPIRARSGAGSDRAAVPGALRKQLPGSISGSLRGEHRIPGDGSRFLSRIHVDDLAALIPRVRLRSERERARDVRRRRSPARGARRCRALRVRRRARVPMPPFVPLESVPEIASAPTASVDGARARSRFDVRFVLSDVPRRNGTERNGRGAARRVTRVSARDEYLARAP